MVSSAVYTIKESDKKSFPKSCDKHSKQGDYVGMVQSRHTTDILFLLAIFGMWVAMSVVGGLAIKNGNPYRLIAPVDDGGSICGISPSVTKMAKLYTVTAKGAGVCVSTCPTTNSLITSENPDDYICLDWVTNGIASGSIPVSKMSYIKTACFSGGIFDPFSSPISGSTCGCMVIQETKSVFNRCIYTSSANREKFSNQSLPDYFVSFMGDIITARYVIFAFGFLLAIVAAFFYSHMLRYQIIGQCLCWTSLVMIFLMMCVLVALCTYTSRKWSREDPQVHSKTARYALIAFSIIMVVVSFLFLCAAIFLRKSINLAIKAISLAATAIERMPFIMVTPLIQVFGFCCFLVPCLFYGFNIASAGTFTVTYSYFPNEATGIKYRTGATYTTDNTKAGEQLWFLTFCLLWTMNFIAGIGSLMIAISISKWYFTAPAERSSNISSCTVMNAYGIVFRFHLGTAAFGGLIIAFVQFLRAVALYIEKHCKSVQQGSRIIRCVFCCVDCCLCMLEKCLKFISKQAYIQTAIHGSGFCTGCRDAFFVISRNIFTIGAVSVISGLALFIGKVWVMTIAGIGGYYYMQGQYDDKMADFIAPTVLIMAIAYMTATMFMDVFHMAVDTVIMCYITDEEQNDGRAVFCDPEIAKFVSANGKLTADHKRIEEEQAAASTATGAKVAGGRTNDV